MFLCGGFVKKKAGGFKHYMGAHIGPLEVGGVALLGEADFFAVDDQRAFVNRHLAFKAPVHAVVLQHVGQVVGLEQVVDRHDLNV